jgi:modulator of FtsH protease HflK
MSESHNRENDGGEVRPAGGRFARAHHVLVYFMLAVVAVWLLSGFYQVKSNEVAIVERLGQYVALPTGKAEELGQGLHYHLPWPIDRVHVIAVQQRLTMPVKVFNASPAEYEEFKLTYLRNPDNPFRNMNPMVAAQMVNAIFNPYLISADQSVVHVEVNVQFRIADAEKWLTSVSHDYHATYDPAAKDDMRNELMQQLVQRALIAQTSRVTFEKLLLERRESLPQSMQKFVEQAFKIETTEPNNPTKKELLDLGIEVLRVEVTQVRPPDRVMPAYQEVLTQRLGRDKQKAEAMATQTAMVTSAKGEAKTSKLEAEKYATTVEQAAKGEADRFSDVLKQYENAPDLTKWNLFAEGATTIMGSAKRVFFTQPGQGIRIYMDPPEPDPNQNKQP